jgi:hypothetical protein
MDAPSPEAGVDDEDAAMAVKIVLSRRYDDVDCFWWKTLRTEVSLSLSLWPKGPVLLYSLATSLTLTHHTNQQLSLEQAGKGCCGEEEEEKRCRRKEENRMAPGIEVVTSF